MNLPYKFKVGNIVDYSGPLGYNSNVRIRSIDPFDGNSERYTLERPFGNEGAFVGYTEHIRPIFFTETHLQRLGFTFNAQLRRYSLHGLIIGSFGYPEGNDLMNMTYVYLGFRIIPNHFPNIPSIEQVKEGTIELPFLHTLQNFCIDNNIENIPFDIIK